MPDRPPRLEGKVAIVTGAGSSGPGIGNGNATHQSTTDPEARLLRKGKGKEAKLVFMAHALMENRTVCWWTSRLPRRRGQRSCRDTVPVAVDQAKERGLSSQNVGRRQRLRHWGLRGGPAPAWVDASRSTEHQWPVQRH